MLNGTKKNKNNLPKIQNLKFHNFYTTLVETFLSSMCEFWGANLLYTSDKMSSEKKWSGDMVKRYLSTKFDINLHDEF